MASRYGIFCAAMLVSIVPTGAFAQVAFDGSWTVSRTGIGCTPTGSISVQFAGGRISGSYVGATGRHVVSGTVRANGSFNFTGRSSETVRFSGRIAGSSGSGSWSVDGRDCRGSLTIRKG